MLSIVVVEKFEEQVVFWAEEQGVDRSTNISYARIKPSVDFYSFNLDSNDRTVLL